MGFQNKDFSHQKLMRVFLLTIQYALLSCASNIHLHVSHHHTGDSHGFEVNSFTGKWESPAKHLRFWGKWQIWAEPAGTMYSMDSPTM